MQALPGRILLAAALAACVFAAPARADFRAVADNAAVLYDAPSAKSKKVYVVNRGYPLEIIVAVEGWSKGRDASGELSWIESRQLADRRTVMVKVPLGQVRERGEDGATLVYEAQQNVLLDLLDVSGGWAHVRHREGQAGYIKLNQVWGQ